MRDTNTQKGRSVDSGLAVATTDPGRKPVGLWMSRQTTLPGAVGVHRVDLGISVPLRVERDSPTVW
jgi:hypothetical protein